MAIVSGHGERHEQRCLYGLTVLAPCAMQVPRLAGMCCLSTGRMVYGTPGHYQCHKSITLRQVNDCRNVGSGERDEQS